MLPILGLDTECVSGKYEKIWKKIMEMAAEVTEKPQPFRKQVILNSPGWSAPSCRVNLHYN